MLFLLLLLLSFVVSGCTLKQLQYFSPGQSVNKTEAQPPASPQSVPATAQPVPLPTGEDAVRNFFNLINEHQVEGAAAMLSSYAAPDKETYNFWSDNFDSLTQAEVVSLEPWNKEVWSADKEVYKVALKMMTKTGQLQYGWEPGENTRWIEVVKNPQTNRWQINTIGTGP